MPYDFNQGDFRQTSEDGTAFGTDTSNNSNPNGQGLPMPVTSPTGASFRLSKRGAKGSSFHPNGEPVLLPARNPPPFGIFDIFPLTLLVKPLLNHGFDVGGKLAQKTRAKLSGEGTVRTSVNHDIPLEITLYLVRASIYL
jgi:ion channel-forming bestrophin family protein